MTSLPMPVELPEPQVIPPPGGTGGVEAECTEGERVEKGRLQDEQQLLRAFRTFAETANSLERAYGLLRMEVVRLHRELEESHAGLARSVEENLAMRRHLDGILESLPCGVAVVSGEGEITRLNPEAKRLLAMVSKSGRNAEGRHLLDPGQAHGLERELEIPPAGKSRERWLAVRRAALPGGGEANPSGASVFILEDVSERKHAEQDKDKRRREQALAEMSAMLAHEVRNPLGGLELFASLLAEAKLGAEYEEWIEHLQHGLRTLAATVNNVLHFHSAPSPDRGPVDLGQLLDWARGFLAPLGRRSAVRVALENQLRGAIFPADRHQLEQVLLNLALNALRAMPEGGELKLAGNPERGKRGGVESLLITLSDTGPGIARENLEQIFTAGFTTRSGSPGLGLAVCRRIVEQHGGTIAVANRLGRGAEFTLRFPLRRNNSKDCEATRSEAIRSEAIRSEPIRSEPIREEGWS